MNPVAAWDAEDRQNKLNALQTTKNSIWKHGLDAMAGDVEDEDRKEVTVSLALRVLHK